MDKIYTPSLSELFDRLTICGMKEIFSADNKDKFREEIKEILHDIQIDIDNGATVTAEMIRAIVVLAQSNLEIWQNENAVRLQKDTTDYEKIAKDLLYTHSLNSTRCLAKTRIQNLIGGRTDHKINYMGGAWDIVW